MKRTVSNLEGKPAPGSLCPAVMAHTNHAPSHPVAVSSSDFFWQSKQDGLPALTKTQRRFPAYFRLFPHSPPAMRASHAQNFKVEAAARPVILTPLKLSRLTIPMSHRNVEPLLSQE